MVGVFQSVSAATIIRGRQDHFDHLIAGLAAQRVAPDELVVAHMQPEPPALNRSLSFPVRFCKVEGDELPLAAARNAAAMKASGDILAFLDVDCIADPDFVRRAAETTSLAFNGVFLPEVRYLPAHRSGWLKKSGLPDYEKLCELGQRHPAKPALAGIDSAPIADHGELWGLAFIMKRSAWFAAGGMDDAYFGYGAEETDFGQRLRAAGVDLYWLGGTVAFHQHHAVHKPPLQHFESILRNAALFRDRWGEWCMDYWLEAFENAGYIERTGDRIECLRKPSDAEIAAARQPDDVRFS
ncbi:MAG: sugar transferase [Sphingorhabdus sp.]|nr:sugar transferase [Sphingorhabdus sp.]